jgi:hypothetical protein
MTGRTLSNTYAETVTLSSAADDPATITSSGLLQAGLYGTSYAAWPITNLGTVQNSAGSGITLMAGGTVTNATTAASITGTTNGVAFSDARGTVMNYGTIAATDAGSVGVGLLSGGIVTNRLGGVIDAGLYAVDSSNVATIVNYGVVGGTAAIGLGFSTGMVTNEAGATIEGTSSGVRLFTAGTVVDAGTISGGGGDAVHFYGGSGLLTLDPGATFIGTVDGGSADNSTLELAAGTVGAIGTLSGIGSEYINVAQITVDAGAHWLLNGTNTLAAGVTLTDNGTFDVASTLDSGGTIDVGSSATLAVQSTITGGAVDFTGGKALLQIGDSTDFAAGIGGLGTSDTLDLTSLGFLKGATASITGGVLSVTSGATTDTLNVAGIADGAQFRTVQDQSGTGTDVNLLCFLAGTSIATPMGEMPVERLRVGDLVLTLGGGRLPINWVGIGRSILPAGRARGGATPVIVREGALAEGVPSRDLRLTKGHSLFLDDALIPVELLINHRSILWDEGARSVEVYHIELDRHEVLLADGAPAESYRDDGNRRLFQNASPDWDRVAIPPPYAPIVTGGPVLAAAWQRLLARAGGAATPVMTRDADVHLVVDGARVDALAEINGTWRFCLTAPTGDVRIVSRAAIPAALGVGPDQRQLGVALRRIALSQDLGLRVIKAEDSRLIQGFHGFEPAEGWRWTDGDARLPEDLFDGLRGVVTLELCLACTAGYAAASLAA